MIALNNSLIIAGAGPTGIAAAISAARNGCRVLLLEKQPTIGGTVTRSLIHTLGGLYDDAGNYLNQGLSIELCERLHAADALVTKRKIGRTWCLAVDPALFQQVVTGWLREEPAITLMTDSLITGGEIRDAKLSRLELLLQGEPASCLPAAALDATGSAELVKLLAPDLLQQDQRRASAGVIFHLRGCGPGALSFPKGAQLLCAIRQAAAEGRLSALAGSAWLDSGLVEDELFVKLTLPPEQLDNPGAVMAARDNLLLFLQQYPDFKQAVCVATGQVGIRDGGRIKGKACLTEDDLLNCRTVPDPACLGAWPLEYWDQEKGVQLRYLPAGGNYAIPLGCLQPDGVERLWAAGKCLSATPQAQASARVVGCCWAMGEAVGRAVVKTLCKEEEQR
jgi:hypothetical protein